MPFIRFLASKRRLRLVSLILYLGEIILLYFCYVKKRLSYIAILALFSCQPFSYIKYTKLNIRLSCDIRLMSNAKCIYCIHFYVL